MGLDIFSHQVSFWYSDPPPPHPHTLNCRAQTLLYGAMYALLCSFRSTQDPQRECASSEMPCSVVTVPVPAVRPV